MKTFARIALFSFLLLFVLIAGKAFAQLDIDNAKRENTMAIAKASGCVTCTGETEFVSRGKITISKTPTKVLLTKHHVDNGFSYTIYKPGSYEVAATMTKDSVWTVYDAPAALTTMLKIMGARQSQYPVEMKSTSKPKTTH